MLRRSTILLTHLVAALVPMAIGWGLSDLPQFFAEPARAGLIGAICAGAIAILILRIDLDPLRTGAANTRKESRTLAAMAAASLLLLAFLPYADRRHLLQIPSEAARWFGLLLCCAGGAIRILALRQLGPHFSAYVTLQPHHQLIQTGIYSRIRHPLYLSLLLAGPGVAAGPCQRTRLADPRGDDRIHRQSHPGRRNSPGQDLSSKFSCLPRSNVGPSAFRFLVHNSADLKQ